MAIFFGGSFCFWCDILEKVLLSVYVNKCRRLNVLGVNLLCFLFLVCFFRKILLSVYAKISRIKYF